MLEENVIYNESCFETMRRMVDGCVDLIVTSPPYDENKKYDHYKDNIGLNKWLDFVEKMLLEFKRVLKDDGRLCLNLSDSHRSPMVPKAHIVVTKMFEMGYMLRGDIIWEKPGYKGSAWGSWCSPSNPVITDNSEHIIVASNKTLKKSGNKEDIDINGADFKEWITGKWVMSPSHIKWHPAVFPEELVRRCLKIYSYKDDLVYDPFIGSGTTAVVCIKENRRFIGSEISKECCKGSNKRIKKVLMNLKQKNALKHFFDVT